MRNKKVTVLKVLFACMLSIGLMNPVQAKVSNIDVDMTQSGFNENGEYFDIYFKVPSDATGVQNIQVSDGILDVLTDYAKGYGYSSYPLMPGDSNLFKVHIINESNKVYTYKNKSFTLTTNQYDGLSLSPFTGYDDKRIPYSYIGAVPASNRAIYQGLFNVKRSSEVTADMMMNIYSYLQEKGYSGTNALTNYMLAYYNDYYKSDYKDFDALLKARPNLADTFAQTGSNSIFKMSQGQYDAYQTKYPTIASYMYKETNKDGSLSVQLKWPEEKLATLSYNAFYNDYFSFAFNDEVTQLDPNSNTSFTRTRGVGDYQGSLYNQTNDYFKTFKEINKDETMSYDMKFAIDGPHVGNGYMKYALSFTHSIQLTPVQTEYYIEHLYYSTDDKGVETLDGRVLSHTLSGDIGDTIDKDSIEAITTYQDNTYELRNRSDSIILNKDASLNKITLTYYRNLPTITVEEEKDPVKPITQKVETVKTDDPSSMIVYIVLALISLVSGIVFYRRKVKE